MPEVTFNFPVKFILPPALIVNENAPKVPPVPSTFASILATLTRPVAPIVRLHDFAGVLFVNANSLSVIVKVPLTVMFPLRSPAPVPSIPSIEKSPAGSVSVKFLAVFTTKFNVPPAILL